MLVDTLIVNLYNDTLVVIWAAKLCRVASHPQEQAWVWTRPGNRRTTPQLRAS
jgi:hypothetical protein